MEALPLPSALKAQPTFYTIIIKITIMKDNHDLGNILRQFSITRRPNFIDTRYEGMGWDEGGDLLLKTVKG
ncbi:unnamed protein product [Prunus armeniaca]|uniref:Uncharacterized protein n=1 Tax=Prunus armeniaca TaxID=36596 RepID=A0A6J5Y867_PRUAR|nr:unnamed protein product [Prunus armeniaca]